MFKNNNQENLPFLKEGIVLPSAEFVDTNLRICYKLQNIRRE